MASYISFQPSDFFNTKLYTGDASTQAVTGVGFAPNMTWIKNRSASGDHSLYDTPRGATKCIIPNGNDDEQTYSTGLTVFGSDGFTVGSQAIVNGSGNNIESWNWKMGTTSGLSGGTITPSAYSIDATRKQGVYAYTGNGTGGATFAHGLGTAPHMVIVKNLTTGGDSWNVNFPFTSLGSTGRLYLNDPSANSATSAAWNSTVPTSTLITLGSNGEVNGSAKSMIFYAFAPVKGYSAFGEYESNEDADGPFIYTGFRPGFVILKNIDRSEGWDIYDTKRNTGNLTDNFLKANSNAAEEVNSTLAIDILSNGFKIRTTSTEINHSTVCYAAFAEFPIVSSNSKAGVAR